MLHATWRLNFDPTTAKVSDGSAQNECLGASSYFLITK
jgi:hypothetical protein